MKQDSGTDIDWQAASACDLGRSIGRGEVDPVGLAENFLRAIDSDPDGSRIYARTTPDRAMSEARAASSRASSGHRLGLLDGVPISWKDLFDTAGCATESGSRLLRNRIPADDARVLKNATAAGLVCLGKTHQSELAFSGLGYNPVTETPPSKYGPGAAPGGSSSGAAASVAFGLAAAAVGSDTGGSVRVPAAWNDLVGLKTTYGRLSVEGVVPLGRSFDTVGPLTRTVEDAAHLLAALEGASPPDLADVTISGARFLVPEGVVFDDIEDAPGAAFEHSVRKLEDAGAHVEHGPVSEFDESLPFAACLLTTEAYAEWMSAIEAEPDLMYAEIRDRFRAGRQFSGTDYVGKRHRLHEFRDSYLAKTMAHDAVLVPTSPILPPDLVRLNADSDYYVRANLLALRNTRIVNLLGLAALTLPAGRPSCGLMLVGHPMTEEKLLRLGTAVEKIL